MPHQISLRYHTLLYALIEIGVCSRWPQPRPRSQTY